MIWLLGNIKENGSCFYIETTMIFYGQLNMFGVQLASVLPWGWLEHLIETLESCTSYIKLSTKDRHGNWEWCHYNSSFWFPARLVPRVPRVPCPPSLSGRCGGSRLALRTVWLLRSPFLSHSWSVLIRHMLSILTTRKRVVWHSKLLALIFIVEIMSMVGVSWSS